jgi:putative acetyltransferase
MADPTTYQFVGYRDEFQPRFAELNRVWLVEFGLLEDPDLAQLDDPRHYFLKPGGEVFCAVRDGQVVGTAAVVPHGTAGEWEMAKLAVDPAERGRGVGRQLVQRCIAFAATHGATRLVLVSNHQLQAAIRVYETLGFEHRPMPETEYLTADVYMELDLDQVKGEGWRVKGEGWRG